MGRQKTKTGQAMQIGSTENKVFSIGGKTGSNEAFQVNDLSGTKKTLEVGMPIKPVKDLSGMYFACNII